MARVLLPVQLLVSDHLAVTQSTSAQLQRVYVFLAKLAAIASAESAGTQRPGMLLPTRGGIHTAGRSTR